MTANSSDRLITEIDIREYFRDSISSSVANQNLSINTETVLYIVNMLTAFTRAEKLYEKTDDGYGIKALALLYGDAIDARSKVERNRVLQRLGDIALFISGLFSCSLDRSLVGVDYYAAMGGSAYASLADATRCGYQGQSLSRVFAELSGKFLALVDVLAEINENRALASDSDVLHLYELWLQTGSRRAARRLQQNGVQPFPVTSSRQ